ATDEVQTLGAARFRIHRGRSLELRATQGMVPTAPRQARPTRLDLTGQSAPVRAVRATPQWTPLQAPAWEVRVAHRKAPPTQPQCLRGNAPGSPKKSAINASEPASPCSRT